MFNRGRNYFYFSVVEGGERNLTPITLQNPDSTSNLRNMALLF